MLRRAFVSCLGVACAAWMGTTAFAAERPDAVRVGVVTFLSGPASVFGVPGQQAAELLAERLTERGGIGATGSEPGVPVELTFVDEGVAASSFWPNIAGSCRVALT